LQKEENGVGFLVGNFFFFVLFGNQNNAFAID
jgi:hypothetical protein